jgi:golgi SNAP receptor complex member 2
MAKREIIAAKQEKAFSYGPNYSNSANYRRVKDFRADLLSLRTKFDSLKRLHSESVLSTNRNELFGRRGFQSATPENPYDAGRIRTNAGLTREEGMLREGDFLRRTEGQLDEFIGRGMSVLDNLVEQRGFLKVLSPTLGV